MYALSRLQPNPISVADAIAAIRREFHYVILDEEEGLRRVRSAGQRLARLPAAALLGRAAEAQERILSMINAGPGDACFARVGDAAGGPTIEFVIEATELPKFSFGDSEESVLLPLVERLARALGYGVEKV